MEPLNPGMMIRPHLTEEMTITFVKKLYGFSDFTIKELNGYDDKNYHIQVNKCDNCKDIWPHGYVLKVLNSLDSEKTSLVEAHIKMAIYLGEKGLTCPQPVKNVNDQYYSVEEITQNGKEPCKHVVRMLTYQPGIVLKDVPYSNETFFNIGKLVAQVDELLKGFQHSAYDNNKTIWSLESVPLLRKFMFAIENKEKYFMVNSIIDAFDNEVVYNMDTLERGLIHADINEQNILMSESADGSWEVSALLDLGDTQHSCYLFELAISICYMCLIAEDPLSAGGHVLAGYNTLRELPDNEFRLLKVCVCARLCQSLVMGAYSYLKDPGNEYLLSTEKKGWQVLELLWGTPREELCDRWKAIVASYNVLNTS